MNKADLIYKDDEYQIYKKYSGETGTFPPTDCLDLIDIAITQLDTWENAGFKNVEDYQKIIDDLCKRLQSTVTK